MTLLRLVALAIAATFAIVIVVWATVWLALIISQGNVDRLLAVVGAAWLLVPVAGFIIRLIKKRLDSNDGSK